VSQFAHNTGYISHISNQYQSAYGRNVLTETALLSTTSNIFQSSDTGKSTLLVSLDLSAAFDTIDYSILLSRLSTSFGVTDTVYSWLQSYLIGHHQSVCIGQHSSTPALCTSGVPQGSVLGPLLFTIYTSPVSSIVNSYSVKQHQYADDTQLFISLSPTGYSADMSHLTKCLATVHSWFCLNGMALNPDKSDAIIIGTHQCSSSYSSLASVDVAGSAVPLADHIKVLGVALDQNLTLNHHVSAVCKSAYHIRAICHIRPAITKDMAKTIACALVGSRLDYANSVLFGVSSHNVTRLQRPQNAAARAVVWRSRRRSTNSLCLLEQLHGLPIEWRVKFKIACITYKTISTTEPAYLHSLLKHYVPSRSLRPSDSNLLSVPHVRTCLGSRSFAVAAPTIWNTLPLDIRNSPSICCFLSPPQNIFLQPRF